MPKESSGGSAETEVREVAVKPTGPASPLRGDHGDTCRVPPEDGAKRGRVEPAVAVGGWDTAAPPARTRRPRRGRAREAAACAPRSGEAVKESSFVLSSRRSAGSRALNGRGSGRSGPTGGRRGGARREGGPEAWGQTDDRSGAASRAPRQSPEPPAPRSGRFGRRRSAPVHRSHHLAQRRDDVGLARQSRGPPHDGAARRRGPVRSAS